MRAAPLVAILLLGLPLAAPAEASGPVAPTLYGPNVVNAARNWTYGGQLVVEDTGAPVTLYGQTIGLYLNGVRAAEGKTDAQGKYLIKISFPVGTHTVHARAFEGTSVASSSPTLTVRSDPTPPAAPALLQATFGFYYTEANVTWRYPWTDGGYPITSFRIDRSVNGGPFATVFTGDALGFVDTDVLPGNTYTYVGSSTTSYGTSGNATTTYASRSVVALVDLVEYRVCESGVCTTVPDGGNYTAAAAEANLTLFANVSGVVDDHPAAAPGLPGEKVHASVTLAAAARALTTTSGAAGAWGESVGPFAAQAPASGCASIPVVAHARPDGQGRDEDTGFIELCV